MGLLSKWVESLAYEYEILPSCTRLVSPHSHCEKCVESCQHQAVSILNGKPVIDHRKCGDCGKCISACPVQAVAGIYPERIIIQNQLVMKGENIPTVKELLIFYKQGIKELIGDSPSQVELWSQPVEEANVILRQLGEMPFSVSIKTVEEEMLYSRREIFSFWKTEAKSVLKQVVPAKMRFNQNALDLQKYYKNFQFTKVTVDQEKCILCEICQNLCQKKCLEIQDACFKIAPQGCSACQLCVDTCPEQAITVEDGISQKKETKLPVYQNICTACNQPFATLREHDKKCVACTKREMYGENRKLG